MILEGFDAAYVERLRAGDPDTERHFIRYFGELILIKLRSRLRSSPLIDDVRQETFLRVFRALRAENGIRDPVRLGSFVNSVCNNVLLEHIRSQVRHRPAFDDGAERADAVEPGTPDPEDQLLGRELQAQVRKAIEDLAPRDRRILHAVFLEERDKDEVCAQFGVKRDYLRVLLHRAKSQLRALYLRQQAPAPPRPLKDDRRSARSTGW